MSLKHFHIFFIVVSTLVLFGLGAWGLNGYFKHDANGSNLIIALIAFVVGAVLIVYGIKVFQKLKDL